VCSPLANTAGVMFTATRVKVRAVDLERVESMDMMGRMRKMVNSMPGLSRLAVNCLPWHFVAHHVSLRHIPRHPVCKMASLKRKQNGWDPIKFLKY
jgi:hypothetical protein